MNIPLLLGCNRIGHSVMNPYLTGSEQMKITVRGGRIMMMLEQPGQARQDKEMTDELR